MIRWPRSAVTVGTSAPSSAGVGRCRHRCHWRGMESSGRSPGPDRHPTGGHRLPPAATPGAGGVSRGGGKVRSPVQDGWRSAKSGDPARRGLRRRGGDPRRRPPLAPLGPPALSTAVEARAERGASSHASPRPSHRPHGRGRRRRGGLGALARGSPRCAGERATAPRCPPRPTGCLRPCRRGVDWRTGHPPPRELGCGEDDPGPGPGGRRGALLLGRVRGSGRFRARPSLRAASERPYAPRTEATRTRAARPRAAPHPRGSCDSDGILQRGEMEA